MAQADGTALVSIRAADGTLLAGRLIHRRITGSRCALLLHGVDDNAGSQMSFARSLGARGFTVLAIDIRAHGASGGELRGYGIWEADDTVRWANYLRTQNCDGGVFGYGASMGAAILIQALGRGAPFEAVVAECPFSSFRLIARERVGQRIGGSSFAARLFAGALVATAFYYAEVRYGIDLTLASPENTAANRAPVLLIHGAADRNILPSHSERLASRLSGASLWLVPGASHANARQAAPLEFDERVNQWFRAVTRSPLER